MISLGARCALALPGILLLSLGQGAAAWQASRTGESSSKQHKSASRASAPSPDLGSLTDGVYHNPFFGIRYKAPFGWVDRTQDMREDSAPGKSLLLLATFSRPPQATGSTVNSAVIIAAESIADYPGLKTAADYFDPITELTTSNGFKVVNEPYEFSLGGRHMVRSDFSKDVGSLKMLQSTLVSLQKGHALSFTFIGGDEEEIENLIGGLSFTGARPPGPARSHAPH